MVGSEVEHLRGVFVEQDAAVHLVQCHFLFSHFLTPQRLLLVLLDVRKHVRSLRRRVLPQRDKPVSSMSIVLLLLEASAAHHSAQL